MEATTEKKKKKNNDSRPLIRPPVASTGPSVVQEKCTYLPIYPLGGSQEAPTDGWGEIIKEISVVPNIAHIFRLGASFSDGLRFPEENGAEFVADTPN